MQSSHTYSDLTSHLYKNKQYIYRNKIKYE